MAGPILKASAYIVEHVKLPTMPPVHVMFEITYLPTYCVKIKTAVLLREFSAAGLPCQVLHGHQGAHHQSQGGGDCAAISQICATRARFFERKMNTYMPLKNIPAILMGCNLMGC